MSKRITFMVGLAVLICLFTPFEVSADTIVAWGDSSYGALDVPPGDDFIAIAAGYWHNLALRSNGTVVGWGRDYYGETNPPVGDDFVAIAAGGGPTHVRPASTVIF